MIVGCPKEIKNHEYRVGLTPGAARENVAHGHQVLIETGAGAGIGANDAAYEAVGAKVVATASEIFAKADMVVKVKEPQPSEWVQLREGQILYTYLHLAPDPEQTKGLLASGVTGVAYETVTDAAGRSAAARADVGSRRPPVDPGGCNGASEGAWRPRVFFLAVCRECFRARSS